MEQLDEIQLLREKIQDKEVIFENILEGTLAGYWDWYIQDNYEYLSPSFKKMFGYEDHEMPNSPDSWQKIIHPDDLSKVLEVYDKHVRSKGLVPYNNEVRYFHKNGSVVWVYCRGKIIEWDAQGNPVRMVGSHVDITKVKEAELTEKRAQLLEVKNKELEQFAYVASHDLQEPLRTILSFSELLEKKYKNNLDDEADLYLKFIKESTLRMKSLVKALLDYSRLGTNLKLTQVNCNDIIADIQKDLKTRIQETDTILKVDALPTLNAYQTELRLLFQNLITNAIKFSKKEVQPIIQISAQEEKEYWKIFIQDNGIGIEDKFKERIFIIFQRLHSKKEYEGTGIGLSQCSKIVDLHGGQIGVESKLNEGSTFYFTIPK
ncbi:sensor histidine kinase [Flexithrix dorotheae]|uniref:sensor histidine kinase n=1 Tax=Flexithrix dorotheae TaxID=70993 RepID=UPI0003794046|nr:PAS domain-containing sensor histidine kinase [Flexithrix dorotheae]